MRSKNCRVRRGIASGVSVLTGGSSRSLVEGVTLERPFPGGVLISREEDQDGYPDHASGDESGHAGVTRGDGGQQSRSGASENRRDDSDHSRKGPEELPVAAEEALDGQALGWRDTAQVMTEFGGGVEVVGP